MTTKVLVVDDQALVRAGFRVLVENAPDMVVVGEAADGLEATELVTETHPDVVMMDIRMPRLDGIEATRLITSGSGIEHIRVLILTTFDLDEYVFAALRAGASGFLLKDTLPVDLMTAIRVVSAGEALLAPSVTRRLISEFSRTPASVPAPPRAATAVPPGVPGADITRLLTQRECEVLRLVASGLSNAEIARGLCISPATAKTHVAHLLTKLDARDRVQLVITAYQAGLAALP
jgi:DNA-binding NarL/FixJ family response regulator